MSDTVVQVNQQGRIVIPAPMRQHLNLQSGSKLVARLDGDRIILEKPEDIFKRLRSTFNSSTSLVDELILERRAEAR
jgi:AbrB family looped-hinge helix DNA binding protein